MEVWVTGIGIVSSVGMNVAENEQSLSLSRDGIGALTLFHSSHNVPVGEVKRSNDELKLLLGLDAAKTYSRTALLGMMAAREAVADSGIDPSGQRVGLISATSVGGMDLTPLFYEEFSRDSTKGRLRYVAGHDCFDSTQKIADFCGIGGYTTTISTACSSAANAIMLGARLIKAGMLDVAVVGGTDALSKFTLNGFKSLMILDEEKCRPFDETRAGLNLGEGAAYLVLQRERPASGGYCRIAGYANTNDAFHQTASSADGEGAFLAMRGALECSALTIRDIGYLNVHGTGTVNNDASEGAAIRRLFGDDHPPFSSTKPFTGHTLAAAGGIEAVFSVLALKNGALYPSLNFATPISGLGLLPVQQYSCGIDLRAVMSSSFGFGGSCSTLIFAR